MTLAGGVRPGAQFVATISADEFTTALPMEVAMDPETLLVYEMNGQVLPREHGYPARVLVPGRYGMKNAKWVVALRPLRREFVDWYGQRNWSRDGVVKTMTRIDTPAPEATLPTGEHRLAGIAYAGDRGIARVEYSIDGGMTWSDARFIEPPGLGTDVWIRWEGTFTLDAEQPADADVARHRRPGDCPARSVQPAAARWRHGLACDQRQPPKRVRAPAVALTVAFGMRASRTGWSHQRSRLRGFGRTCLNSCVGRACGRAPSPTYECGRLRRTLIQPSKPPGQGDAPR